MHDKIEWVTEEQLDDYEFAPADIPIVRKLASKVIDWVYEENLEIF